MIVFGATGGTGREVVAQALQRGYRVSAIVRNPDAFKTRHPNLTIQEGDVFRPSSFESVLSGKDAVISCLGAGRNTRSTGVCSVGMQNILTAMDRAGTRRIIGISAAAIHTHKAMGPFTWVLAKLLQAILKGPFSDLRKMEAILENSHEDWTVVIPPRLVDKSPSHRYRTAIGSHLKRPFTIARSDLAHYMLDIIDNPGTFQSKIEIAY